MTPMGLEHADQALTRGRVSAVTECRAESTAPWAWSLNPYMGSGEVDCPSPCFPPCVYLYCCPETVRESLFVSVSFKSGSCFVIQAGVKLMTVLLLQPCENVILCPAF